MIASAIGASWRMALIVAMEVGEATDVPPKSFNAGLGKLWGVCVVHAGVNRSRKSLLSMAFREEQGRLIVA